MSYYLLDSVQEQWVQQEGKLRKENWQGKLEQWVQLY